MLLQDITSLNQIQIPKNKKKEKEKKKEKKENFYLFY